MNLKRLIRRPLNRMGLDIVRTGPRRWAATSFDRLAHAQGLGFAPRVIIDAGAFRGRWASRVAEIFPGAQLILVEPNPFLQPVIAEAVRAIRPAPVVLDVALGAQPGSATLKIWRDREHDTGASLLDHVQGDAGTVVDVRVDTLDRIAAAQGVVPDLVKLDLQGFELAALRGGTAVMAGAEFMVIEFSCLDAYVDRTTPRDLLDIAGDHGFVLYDIVECHYRPYDGALTGGDFFFVKRDSSLRAHKDWA